MKDENRAPRKSSIRALPVPLWPTADRDAWNTACRAGARLRRGGAASHLKPITQNDHARRYGYFLDFLSRSGWLDPSAGAGAQVTPDVVDSYVAELKERVSSVTTYGSIHKLRRILQLIAPDRELGWLIEIERELASEMRPRSKWDRLVLIEVLIEAGLTLVAEAEKAEGLPLLARARMVRNGLMVAVLACCPIRPKNFAALEIGRSIVNVNGAWWIVLASSETKEKRPDERPVPNYLAETINRYLDTYRPILARSDSETNALWLSMHGKPLSYASVGELISETTRSTVGVKISPHLFRTAAATTAAIHAGDNPHLGSALLHHRHSTVTAERYNRATSLNAAKAYAEITRRYRQLGSARTPNIPPKAG
jgi:site-specific recombinase XerD